MNAAVCLPDDASIAQRVALVLNKNDTSEVHKVFEEDSSCDFGRLRGAFFKSLQCLTARYHAAGSPRSKRGWLPAAKAVFQIGGDGQGNLIPPGARYDLHPHGQAIRRGPGPDDHRRIAG